MEDSSTSPRRFSPACGSDRPRSFRYDLKIIISSDENELLDLDHLHASITKYNSRKNTLNFASIAELVEKMLDHRFMDSPAEEYDLLMHGQ